MWLYAYPLWYNVTAKYQNPWSIRMFWLSYMSKTLEGNDWYPYCPERSWIDYRWSNHLKINNNFVKWLSIFAMIAKGICIPSRSRDISALLLCSYMPRICQLLMNMADVFQRVLWKKQWKMEVWHVLYILLRERGHISYALHLVMSSIPMRWIIRVIPSPHRCFRHGQHSLSSLNKQYPPRRTFY